MGTNDAATMGYCRRVCVPVDGPLYLSFPFNHRKKNPLVVYPRLGVRGDVRTRCDFFPFPGASFAAPRRDFRWVGWTRYGYVDRRGFLIRSWRKKTNANKSRTVVGKKIINGGR